MLQLPSACHLVCQHAMRSMKSTLRVDAAAHVAPEMLLGAQDATPPVDVYSLGVLMWEVRQLARAGGGLACVPRAATSASACLHAAPASASAPPLECVCTRSFAACDDLSRRAAAALLMLRASLDLVPPPPTPHPTPTQPPRPTHHPTHHPPPQMYSGLSAWDFLCPGQLIRDMLAGLPVLPPLPGCPPAYQALVAAATHPDPAGRPALPALQASLAALLAGLPPEAHAAAH